jgi:hypothetical protein
MMAQKKLLPPVPRMVAAVVASILLLATRSSASASAEASVVTSAAKGGIILSSVTPPSSYRRRLLSQEEEEGVVVGFAHHETPLKNDPTPPEGFALELPVANKPDPTSGGGLVAHRQTATATTTTLSEEETVGLAQEPPQQDPLPGSVGHQPDPVGFTKGPPGGERRRRDERCVGGGFTREPGNVPDPAPSGGEGGEHQRGVLEGQQGPDGATDMMMADPCERRGARRRQLQQEVQQPPLPSLEDEQRLLQELFDSHFQPPDEHNTGKVPRRTSVCLPSIEPVVVCLYLTLSSHNPCFLVCVSFLG